MGYVSTFSLSRAEREIFSPFTPTSFGDYLYALPEPQESEEGRKPVRVAKHDRAEREKRTALAFVADLLMLTPSAVREMTISTPLSAIKLMAFAMLGSSSFHERQQARVQLGLSPEPIEKKKTEDNDDDDDDSDNNNTGNDIFVRPSHIALSIAGPLARQPGWRTLAVVPVLIAKTSQKIRRFGLKMMNALIDKPEPSPKHLVIPERPDTVI